MTLQERNGKRRRRKDKKFLNFTQFYLVKLSKHVQKVEIPT